MRILCCPHLLVVSVLLVGTSAASAETLLTLFPDVAPRGRASEQALSGAVLAHPSPRGLAHLNPAGAPLTAGTVGVTFGTEAVRELEANETETNGFRGFAAQMPFHSGAGRLGVGASILQRQQENTIDFANGRDQLTYGVEEFLFTPSVALQVFDEVAVGVSAQMAFGSEKVSKTVPDQILESQDYSTLAWKAGFMGRFGPFSGAATLETSAEARSYRSVEPASGGQLGRPYRPARAQIGFGFDVPAIPLVDAGFPIVLDLLVLTQIDYMYLTEETSDAVVRRPGAQLRNAIYAEYSPVYVLSLAPVEPIQQDVDVNEYIIPRVGMEALLFRTDNLRGTLRVGSWREPLVGFGDETLWHFTQGYHVSGWGVEAGISLDSTRDSNDFTVDFGLDIVM